MVSPGPGTEVGLYTCILEAKTSWLEHEFALGDGAKWGQAVRRALLGLRMRFSRKCWLRMDGKEVQAGLKTLLESHQAEKGTNQSISTMRSSSSCDGHQDAPSIRKARS